MMKSWVEHDWNFRRERKLDEFEERHQENELVQFLDLLQ